MIISKNYKKDEDLTEQEKQELYKKQVIFGEEMGKKFGAIFDKFKAPNVLLRSPIIEQAVSPIIFRQRPASATDIRDISKEVMEDISRSYRWYKDPGGLGLILSILAIGISIPTLF